VQSELIASCWKSIEGEGPDLTDPNQRWVWADLNGGRSGRTQSVSYDPRQPEKGLRVQALAASH
jgi:hypothetical protein